MKNHSSNMTLAEQESELVKRLRKVHKLEESIRLQLAKVRGGNSVESEIDRPDLMYLKADDNG